MRIFILFAHFCNELFLKVDILKNRLATELNTHNGSSADCSEFSDLLPTNGRSLQWCGAICNMLQHVAVCCSVFVPCCPFCRRVSLAVCCSVLQCVAVCCSVLQCVVVCCSVLQCVAVCCSVLQCVLPCCPFCRRVSLAGHRCGLWRRCGSLASFASVCVP